MIYYMTKIFDFYYAYNMFQNIYFATLIYCLAKKTSKHIYANPKVD